jgi:hypothetical protein
MVVGHTSKIWETLRINQFSKRGARSGDDTCAGYVRRVTHDEIADYAGYINYPPRKLRVSLFNYLAC